VEGRKKVWERLRIPLLKKQAHPQPLAVVAVVPVFEEVHDFYFECAVVNGEQY
jgi:hypothetical protein